MKNRGWTQESVEQTIQHPVRVVRVRDIRWKKDRSGRRDDPATAYVRDDGHYVVRNDIDGTIVQVSDRAKAEWKPPY
ncbi:colicin E5-related ribonuclease [Paraburkholderia rhizosphaerae]